jgi:hypothetical protein
MIASSAVVYPELKTACLAANSGTPFITNIFTSSILIAGSF